MTYSYGAQSASCADGALAKAHAVVRVGADSSCYDANGNLVSGGGRTYTWTADNRPATVSYAGGTESYLYDADGERVAKAVTVGTTTTTTVYFQGLWEQTTSGARTLYYTFHGQVVAMRTSAGVTYLHGDHLGSVSLATDSAGAVVSRQDFDPWGAVRSGDVRQTSLNYTGQRLDGTGLLYYHARYYDPGVARFVSADSIIPGQSDKAGTANPQSLNRYAYVNNNPVKNTDPTGHCIEDLCVGEAIIVGALLTAAEPEIEEGLEEAAPLIESAAEEATTFIEGLVGAEETAASEIETGEQVVQTEGDGGGTADAEASGNPRDTCGDCGTHRPDLVRDSGQVKIDSDGVSLRCRVCTANGDTPLNPKEKYWTRSFDEYEQKARELGYGDPRYTPEYGRPPTGHFSAFEGAPEGSAAETSSDINTFVRANKQRP